MTRAALLALLVLVACKEKHRNAELAELQRYADLVCACNDTACLAKVNEEWSRQVDRASKQKLSRFDQDQLETIGQQISACTKRIADAASPAAEPDLGLPALPVGRQADSAIAAARAWQQSTSPKLAVWQIRASYVDAKGVLDDEHGFITVQYGAPGGDDDPKRKTGAPVKAAAAPACHTLRFVDRWTRNDSTCADVPSYIPKCTVVEIWKTAIESGAPPDALAVLVFENSSSPAWGFEIEDEPRKIHISRAFPDDCERTLEKSP